MATRTWLRELAELRDRFGQRSDDVLNYLVVAVMCSHEAAVRLGYLDGSTLPEFPNDIEWLLHDKRIIRDTVTNRTQSKDEARGGTRLMVFQRRVLYGNADETSLHDFDEWSNVAGLCLKARPKAPVEFRKQNPSERWLDYMVHLAVQNVDGCPLSTRLKATQLDWEGRPLCWHVVLPVNVFRASVQVIETMSDHSPELFGQAFQLPDRLRGNASPMEGTIAGPTPSDAQRALSDAINSDKTDLSGRVRRKAIARGQAPYLLENCLQLLIEKKEWGKSGRQIALFSRMTKSTVARLIKKDDGCSELYKTYLHKGMGRGPARPKDL